MMDRNARRARVAPAVALAVAVALVGFAAGCTNEPQDGGAKRHGAAPSNAAAHQHGPHGGVVEPIGPDAGHVEIVHDAKAGRLDLYFLGADGKTPAGLEVAPALNLQTADGPRQLGCEPAGDEGHYRVVDDALQGEHPTGQIVVKKGGDDYLVMLAHHHHGEGGDSHPAGDAGDHHADAEGRRPGESAGEAGAHGGESDRR